MMKETKQSIIDKFFAAFANQDIGAVSEVMDDNVAWYFPGSHPYAGVKKGISEVLDFFQTMGKIMGSSKSTIEKLIVAENEDYLIECIHSKTNRDDAHNLEHRACVLWTFRDGRIIEGRHFFADQAKVDDYFTDIAGLMPGMKVNEDGNPK